MNTLHRDFEGEARKKEQVGHVYDEKGYRKLNGSKFRRYLKRYKSGSEMLVTAAHSTDALLLELAAQGVILFTSHWHTTGIDKGLAPEVIAQKFAELPDDKLRKFVPRPDLVPLRQAVSLRQALMEYRKACSLRITASQRNLGSYNALVEAMEEQLAADQKEIETPADKEIIKLASVIPDCILWNEITGVKAGWHTAASVVAYLGDISRFPSVASLWHYCGYHVVNNAAPKRQRGNPVDWSPRLRTTLWLMADSMLKAKNPIWRPFYEQARSEELAVHHLKCDKCGDKKSAAGFPLAESHSGARARRKMTKEILKQFFLAMTGQR